jgi:hypothetical protein
MVAAARPVMARKHRKESKQEQQTRKSKQGRANKEEQTRKSKQEEQTRKSKSAAGTHCEAHPPSANIVRQL